MKSGHKYITIGIFGILVCVMGFYLVPLMSDKISAPNSGNETNTEETPMSDSDYIDLSFDEILAQSTHIIEGEFIGESNSDAGMELIFKPLHVLKGELDTNDNDEVLYVQPLSEALEEEISNHKNSKSSLLFLQKNSSVYYDHDKYVQLNGLHLTSNQAEWEEEYENVQDSLKTIADDSPSSEGVKFTDSTELEEILSVSENIFLVKIAGIYAESAVAPTTVYHSHVTEVIKNTPANDGDILITFFNDTVEIGEEYLVLLADATDTAPVYTLSSKNSVYHVDEAATLAELDKLLQEATEFETIINVKSDEDILQEERKTANKH